ncbi:MAG: holo-[acyl-carrier protein] synthase [Solirubrobacteraceae bacterium]|jgi:holo-[acyl-carrier protein] synthase|nr:holo-[acyl-carrier protein] synthase [Solirubrobacteraceae bacterium]MEA2289116.1 holo-[acyl-carrier protein] synthase [Solirubrobacteraceae bacterium]
MSTLEPSPMPAEQAAISVGVDIVDVPRIERVLGRDLAAERLLTAAELEYCRARPAVAEHVAARFAAKEAVLKALGTGLSHGLRWTDVEVLNEPHGQPRVRLHRAAAALAAQRGLVAMEISLSHTAALAIAHAVALWTTDDRHDPKEHA